MHIEQSTLGSSWVSVNTLVVNKCNNVSQKHLQPPHVNAFAVYFSFLKSQGMEFVSNFRVYSSRLAEFLLLWYPD